MKADNKMVQKIPFYSKNEMGDFVVTGEIVVKTWIDNENVWHIRYEADGHDYKLLEGAYKRLARNSKFNKRSCNE